MEFYLNINVTWKFLNTEVWNQGIYSEEENQ